MPWDPQGEKRTVVVSLESEDGTRCIDVVDLTGGQFGLKEFRRDPEDGGGWTLVSDFTGRTFLSIAEATHAARLSFPWLKPDR
jgi:hypothetical protein